MSIASLVAHSLPAQPSMALQASHNIKSRRRGDFGYLQASQMFFGLWHENMVSINICTTSLLFNINCNFCCSFLSSTAYNDFSGWSQHWVEGKEESLSKSNVFWNVFIKMWRVSILAPTSLLFNVDCKFGCSFLAGTVPWLFRLVTTSTQG